MVEMDRELAERLLRRASEARLLYGDRIAYCDNGSCIVVFRDEAEGPTAIGYGPNAREVADKLGEALDRLAELRARYEGLLRAFEEGTAPGWEVARAYNDWRQAAFELKKRINSDSEWLCEVTEDYSCDTVVESRESRLLRLLRELASLLAEEACPPG